MVYYADELGQRHRARPACPWYGFHLIWEASFWVLIPQDGNECPFGQEGHLAPCAMEVEGSPIVWYVCTQRPGIEKRQNWQTLLDFGLIFPSATATRPMRIGDWYAAFQERWESPPAL